MTPTLLRFLRRGGKRLSSTRTASPDAPAPVKDPVAQARLQALADSVPAWWHSIDFGHGVVTKGHKTPDIHRSEMELLSLPDLRGKSVLDIGAWDGFYSFEAERRGAARVVALDYFAWYVAPLHSGAAERFIQFTQNGPEPAAQSGDEDALRGKKGFDVARSARNSKVEAVIGDYMSMDLQSLGTFDVTFFLGVLYHMKEPFLALQRLAELTREVAVIETAAIVVPGMEDSALCEFYETTELAGDPTNWWAPNAKALVGMARAAGFRRVEITSPAIPKSQLPRHGVFRRRLHARAWK